MSAPRHTARYTRDAHGQSADPRLYSPVFPRNSPPMIAALARLLEGRAGRVLEIGCGTGQHATAFSLAFPELDWIASDPEPDHRASTAAWSAALTAPLAPPLDLDAARSWAEYRQVVELAPFEAVVSMNVIHIAPWSVAMGILTGAAAVLAPGGLLIFYGPFMEDGCHTGPSNAAFDAGLRADNPDWGIRDIAALGREAGTRGLTLDHVRQMPADNRLVVFRRQTGTARV